MKNSIPEPQKILITYDKTLQLITEKDSEECIISKDAPFLFILGSVLESYPEIKKRFPPGVLGFTINGKPPENNTILKDGDTVHFTIPSSSKHIAEGQ